MVFLYKTTIGDSHLGPDGSWLDRGPGPVYDKEAAKYLSSVAGWSYSDRESFVNKLASIPGLEGANYAEVSVRNEAMLVVATAQIIRTANKKSIIVCFRGTELTNIVNWLVDAGTELVKLPGPGNEDIQVHKGFLRNFQEVWNGYKGVRSHLLHPETIDASFPGADTDSNDDYTDEYFNSNQSPSDTELDKLKSIYICGHSLGAAMAFLCGLAMQQDQELSLWNKVRGIYTYGQPMVISDKAKCVKACDDRIGKRLFRHVYENDVVPHVPPLLTGAFDHIGTEYKYKYKGGKKQWVERSGGSFLIFKDRATQVISITGTIPFAVAGAIAENVQWLKFLPDSPWSFTDHSPLNYMEALWAPTDGAPGLLTVGAETPLLRLDGV